MPITMIILIVYILIQHAAYFGNGYDIELTAKVDSTKDLLKKIISGTEPLDIRIGLVSDKVNSIFKFVPRTAFYDTSSYILKPLPLNAHEPRKEIDTNKFNDKQDHQTLLLEKIKKRGKNWLSSTYKILKKNLKVPTSSKDIQESKANYDMMLSLYATKLFGLNSKDPLERELIIVDIVDYSNGLIYEESVKLKGSPDNYSNSSYKALDDAIYRTCLRQKQHDFYFLCKTTNLCRPFPGYVDYFSDLLGEILDLSEVKFEIFMVKAVKLLRNKFSLMDIIVGEALSHELGQTLERYLFQYDFEQIRKSIGRARRYILHRRRVALALGDGNYNKLYRVLMDMVDRAFSKTPRGELENQFESAINGLRVFNTEKSADLENIVTVFLGYSLLNLDRFWNHDAKLECRAILEAALHGKAEQEFIQSYLLISGSNFTNPKQNKQSK